MRGGRGSLGRQGGQRDVRAGRGPAEQLDHRRVLLRRQQLRLQVEAERVGAQPPLRRQIPGPGRTADVARDHVAEAHPVPAPGQREQPLRLGLGRRHAHDQVVRRPHVRVGGHRSPGQHRVDAGRRHRVPDLGGAFLQLRQGLVESADNLDPFGRNLGQSVAETDERDPHLVRPPVRHQLDGERRQRRLYHLARAAHGDQAVGHLQVHQDPARVVGAEGHQARVRRERGRAHLRAGLGCVEAGDGRERQPPHLAAVGRLPRARRVRVGRGDPEVQVLEAQVGREHRGRRLARRAELPGQVPQAGVEHSHRGVVRAEPQGLLGQRRVRFGTRDPAAERPPPQLLPPLAAERGQHAGRQQRGGGQLVGPARGLLSRRRRGGPDSMIPNGPGRCLTGGQLGFRGDPLAGVPGQAELARQLGRDRARCRGRARPWASAASSPA